VGFSLSNSLVLHSNSMCHYLNANEFFNNYGNFIVTFFFPRKTLWDPPSSLEYSEGGLLNCRLQYWLVNRRDFTGFEPVTYGLPIGNMPLEDGSIN
jgi:hypothetical protein